MADEKQTPETGKETPNPADTSETPQVPETWDAFMEAQPEPVRELFTNHVSGLKSALVDERDQRKDFERQLRDVAKQLEDGSDAKAQLERLTNEYEEAERRIAFYESAPAELVNHKLGWLAATEMDAFDRRGNVNWDAVKDAYPELFRQPKQAPPPGDAGSGAGGSGPRTFDMNDAVRAAAGRNRI